MSGRPKGCGETGAGEADALEILGGAGFSQLLPIAESQAGEVRKRLFELLADEGVADPLARSCFWDEMVHLKNRCPSKTIMGLGHHVPRVACWLDRPNAPILTGVPPQHPWAHLVETGNCDLYILPLPNSSRPSSREFDAILGFTRGKPVGGIVVVTERKLLGQNLITAYPSLR